MAEPRMGQVARELLRLTKAGKVKWERTVGKNEYQVIFPDLSLTIACDADQERFRLNLVGETGWHQETLEWISGESNLEQDPGLPEIYELAAAYVRDGTLDRALQYLKQA